MRRLAIIFFTTMLFVLVSACSSDKGIDVSNLQKSEYNADDLCKEVTMTIKETTITPDTEMLHVHFINSSKNEYSFGLEPHLEIEVKDIWYVVPPVVDAFWDESLYKLPAKGDADMEFPLSTIYGSLSEGHYRIVKPIISEQENTFVITEFTIEK